MIPDEFTHYFGLDLIFGILLIFMWYNTNMKKKDCSSIP